MEIVLSELISDHFFPTFNKWERHNIDYGPRASTKTSKNCLKIAMKMIEERAMEVVVVRENMVDHRKTTFLELIQAFRRLGVHLEQGVNYPKGTTGYLYIKTPWDSYIHFAHLTDLTSLKGIVPSSPEKFIGVSYFFEIDQFKEKDYAITQAISSFSRGIKPFYHNLYEMNPHEDGEEHWTWDWLNKMKQRDDVIVIEGTYLDVPLKKRELWFGELLNEIEQLKRIDKAQYDHVYLGLGYLRTGAVYKGFSPERHCTIMNLKELGYYMSPVIGVDYADANDATTFYLKIYNRNLNGIRIPIGYYHRNGFKETPGEKIPQDYANDLMDFIADCYDIVQQHIVVKVDSAASHFIKTCKATLGKSRAFGKCSIKGVSKNPSNEIKERIEVENLMYGADFIKINQNDSTINGRTYSGTKYLRKAMILTKYNDKTKKRIEDTEKFFDCVDAFEYSWMEDIKAIKSKILQGTQYKE